MTTNRMFAAALAAITILLFGAYPQPAHAEDFSQASVVTSLFTNANAKKCPDKVCKTQNEANIMNVLCRQAARQCTTAWAVDEPAKGERCSTAVKALCPFTSTSGTTPVADTNPAKSKKRDKKLAKVVDPCNPNPCDAGSTCSPGRKIGKVQTLICTPAPITKEKRIEVKVTEEKRVCGAEDCQNFWHSVLCWWKLWVAIALLIVIILVILIFGTPRVRGRCFLGLLRYRKERKQANLALGRR